MIHPEARPLRGTESFEHDDATYPNHIEQPKPKRKAIYFWIVVFLTSSLFILLTYFFWPRYPEIGFVDAKLDDKRHSKAGKLVSSLSRVNGTIELGLVLHLYANSSLYFDLGVKNITSDGYLKIDNGDYVRIGRGYLSEPITIPKRTSFFNFNMTFTLKYKKNSEENSGTAFKDFLKHCGLDGKNKTSAHMKYIAEAEIPLLSWTGHKPKFVKDFDFPCPVNLQFFGKVKHLFSRLFSNKN